MLYPLFQIGAVCVVLFTVIMTRTLSVLGIYRLHIKVVQETHSGQMIANTLGTIIQLIGMFIVTTVSTSVEKTDQTEIRSFRLYEVSTIVFFVVFLDLVVRSVSNHRFLLKSLSTFLQACCFTRHKYTFWYFSISNTRTVKSYGI